MKTGGTSAQFLKADGSVDSTTNNFPSSGTDQISSFTTKGPGITLFAPGSNIRSAFSNTNRHADSTYYLNSSFKQAAYFSGDIPPRAAIFVSTSL